MPGAAAVLRPQPGKKKKKNYASSKKLLTSIKEKGPLGKKSPSTRKKGGSVRIRRVAGRQASRPLLIGLKVRKMLKRTSGLNKLMSIVHSRVGSCVFYRILRIEK